MSGVFDGAIFDSVIFDTGPAALSLGRTRRKRQPRPLLTREDVERMEAQWLGQPVPQLPAPTVIPPPVIPAPVAQPPQDIIRRTRITPWVDFFLEAKCVVATERHVSVETAFGLDAWCDQRDRFGSVDMPECQASVQIAVVASRHVTMQFGLQCATRVRADPWLTREFTGEEVRESISRRV